jgi:DNA polymerase III epsilon subunit-like protein
VAHNAEFDFNVLVNAIKWDLGIDPIVLDKPVFCTMKLSKNICRIPSNYGFKSPKLSELYQFVMKKAPLSNSLHGSLYDAEILTEIVQNCNELREQMGLPVTNINKLLNGNQKVPSKTLSIKLT